MAEELTLAQAIEKYGPDFLNKAYDKSTRDYRKARKQKAKTDWVEMLIQLIDAEGLPPPGQELQFAKSIGRRWRFDLYWNDPGQMVAVEVDGGTFGRPVICHSCGVRVKMQTKKGRWIDVRAGGGHNTGTGHQKDAEKRNAAIILGWRVLTVTPRHIENGQAIEWIRKALTS